MSWQRVIETARKIGMPIIITDVVGRDPMVILPLEQFEAMAGDTAQPIPEPAPGSKITHEPTSTRGEEQDQHLIPPSSGFMRDLAPLPDNLSNTEIPLEEGFYLEPIEDKP